jgi:hypothetical protein
MSTNQPFREQIDACRPGSDDLSLPALAGLAAAVDGDREVAAELSRSQQFDRAVSAAMHDVPLPAGLLERLEARLTAGDFAPISDDEPLANVVAQVTEPASEPAVHTPLEVAKSKSRFGRRELVTGSIVAAALVLMAAAVVQLWPPASRQISKDQLTLLAMAWIQDNSPISPAWQPARQAAPNVLTRSLTTRRQRSFVTANRERAVVYDLTPIGKQQVLLFVIQTPHRYKVGTSPYTTLNGSSGGVAMAAWQNQGTLYLLAVREVGQKLEDFIKQQHLALRPKPARPA